MFFACKKKKVSWIQLGFVAFPLGLTLGKWVRQCDALAHWGGRRNACRLLKPFSVNSAAWRALVRLAASCHPREGMLQAETSPGLRPLARGAADQPRRGFQEPMPMPDQLGGEGLGVIAPSLWRRSRSSPRWARASYFGVWRGECVDWAKFKDEH